MNIVVLDGYTLNPGDLSWEQLEKLGSCHIYARTSLTDTEEIIGRIGDAEVVFTNKTPLSETVLKHCPKLKYVGVLATGYNVVDIKAAAAAGVTVTNIPSYGTEAVGQFAIALLLEICHHIGHHSDEVAKGAWARSKDWCFWDYPLIELAGKTMGIIGFGRIGQATGKTAGALGMRVLANDGFESEAGRAIAEYVDRDTLFQEADVIALHCPLFPDTEGLICRETIGKMKDGVIIINNSRGPLIVEQDLADALNAGKVFAAGLDVVSEEPISNDNPLLTAKNCILTPHISWASKESRARLLKLAAENLSAFEAGNPVNVVN